MAIINSIIEKLTYYEDQDWDRNQDLDQVNNNNDKDVGDRPTLSTNADRIR